MDWTAISGIAAIVQAIVVIIALVYAILQLKEASKARSLSVFLPLFEELNSPESVAQRKKLYTQIGSDPALYTDEQEELINNIVNQLDFLGFLTQNKLINFKLAAPLYYGTVIRCWEKSSAYVLHQRELRKTKFAYYFEFLYVKCKRYARIYKPDEQILTYQKQKISKDSLKKRRNSTTS